MAIFGVCVSVSSERYLYVSLESWKAVKIFKVKKLKIGVSECLVLNLSEGLKPNNMPVLRSMRSMERKTTLNLENLW